MRGARSADLLTDANQKVSHLYRMLRLSFLIPTGGIAWKFHIDMKKKRV